MLLFVSFKHHDNSKINTIHIAMSVIEQLLIKQLQYTHTQFFYEFYFFTCNCTITLVLFSRILLTSQSNDLQ